MIDQSEITLKEVWDDLCKHGLVEIRVNGRTVWSDGAMDALADRDDYIEIVREYQKVSEERLLEDYSAFRVTGMKIQIVDFHHCTADIDGYFVDNADLEVI